MQVYFVLMLKKSTERVTLNLSLNSHKELLQVSSVKMLVLQLPSSSLAGQNPYMYPWFSQVCESWLDSAPLVLVLQGPQALVASGDTREPCWDMGWLPQLIPQLCS